MGTQFTGVASGNASNPAVWNVGVVVPGDGDTVLTGPYNIVWDMTSTIGAGGATGTEAIQVQVGGELEIAAGVVLTAKGDVNVQRGGKYTQIGHVALDTTGITTRSIKQLTSGTGYATFNISGPSKTNRATLSKIGTGVAKFDASAGITLLYSKVNFSNVIVFDFGSATVKAFDHYMFDANATSYGRDVAFVRCGKLKVAIAHADNIVDWDGLLISQPLNNTDSFYVSGVGAKSASGVRSLKNVYVYSEVKSGLSVSSSDVTCTQWVLVNTIPAMNFSSTLRNTVTDWLIILDLCVSVGTTAFLTLSKLSSVYTDVMFVCRYDNQHYCGGGAGGTGASNKWIGTIFDGDGYVGPTDPGDCFMPFDRIEVTNPLAINKAGTLYSGLATTSVISIKNATSHDSYGLSIGETNGSANQVEECSSCLFTSQEWGFIQRSAFVPFADSTYIDFNGYYDLSGVTNIADPIIGGPGYLGAQTFGSWYANGTYDGRTGRGGYNIKADPKYKDPSRTFRKWAGVVLGVDTSSPVAWTLTEIAAELIKNSGLDNNGVVAVPAANSLAANCRTYLREGFTPTNLVYKGTGKEGADFGAVPVSAALNVSVWVDDHLQTYRQGGEDGVSGNSSLTIHSPKRSYQSFQVLIHSPSALTNVDVTLSAINGPVGPVTDVIKFLQCYVDCSNVSRVEYAPGIYPDPLIPDVDPYYHEKRDAFPFALSAGKVQGVSFDVGFAAGDATGTYTATATVTVDGVAVGRCAVTFIVHDVPLPLQPTFPFDMKCWEPHRGYGTDWAVANDYWFDLQKAHQICGLRHRLSFRTQWIYGNGQGVEWDNVAKEIKVTSWLPDSKWDEEEARGELIKTGAYKGARKSFITTHRHWPVDFGGASFVPVEHRSLATKQYLQKCWDRLDSIGANPEERFYLMSFYDEPSSSEYVSFRGNPSESSFVANFQTAKDAHEGLQDGAFVRSMVSASRQAGLMDFDLHGFYCRGIQSAACPGWDRDCIYGGTYQSIENDRPDRESWLYLTCVSSGCGIVGPASLSGQVDLNIDAGAMYMRLISPVLYEYFADGSIFWAAMCFPVNNDGSPANSPWVSLWHTAMDGHTNGDSFFVYPGVADGTGRNLIPGTRIIGGTTDIPVESIRLKHWRDILEDIELYRIAESKHGRAAVVSALAGVFTTDVHLDKYWELNLDPAAFRTARQAIIALAEDNATIQRPVLSGLHVDVTGETTATAMFDTDLPGGVMEFVATVNQFEADAVILNGLSQPIVASGSQRINLSGLTPGWAYYLHIIHSGLDQPSIAIHSERFVMPNVQLSSPEVITASEIARTVRAKPRIQSVVATRPMEA